jgi:hypothetical protein
MQHENIEIEILVSLDIIGCKYKYKCKNAFHDMKYHTVITRHTCWLITLDP